MIAQQPEEFVGQHTYHPAYQGYDVAITNKNRGYGGGGVDKGWVGSKQSEILRFVCASGG